jgi:hypothetical protein
LRCSPSTPFSALLPEATQSANDAAPEALAGGMAGWATSDSPWVHITDKVKFGEVLERVRQLAPSRIFSSHPPAADGTSMDEFIKILAMVPDAEAHQPPNAEQFGQIIEAMTAAQQPAASPSSAPTSPPSHRSRLPDRVLASARGSRLRPWSRQPCRSEPASS